jgi:hypothetical protein
MRTRPCISTTISRQVKELDDYLKPFDEKITRMRITIKNNKDGTIK